MSDTLTQLVTKLQALLLGDSDTFSTATCTAAIRHALLQLNLTVPQHAAETQDAATGQYEYELEDGTAMNVIDVLREGIDTYKDINLSLPFDFYFEDDAPNIRLRTAEQTGQTLIIRYTKPYTINGLDSATDSTMPAIYDTVLLDGAAWTACLIRSAGRIEPINMNAGVSASFERMSQHFRQAFEAGLAWLGNRKFTVSQPSGKGWNDYWNGQY